MFATVSTQSKVAGAIVLFVLFISLVSVWFGKGTSVQYSSWFTNQVNMLVDSAEIAANHAKQDEDAVTALQDYTAAISIMECLRTLVPDEELTRIAGLKVQVFLNMLVASRQQLVKEISGPHDQ